MEAEQDIKLLPAIIDRLKKYWFIPLIVAIALGAAGYFYAKKQPRFYTALSTLFSLDDQKQSSSLSSLISGTSNFGGEANVYIVDVANSRVVSEKVAGTVLPEFGMKTIGELLITSYNKAYPSKDPMKVPNDLNELKIIGSQFVRNNMFVEMTKTGLIQLKFTSSDPSYLTQVTNVIINTTIDFYNELKIEKAASDYRFTQKKLDSIDYVLQQYDRRAIQIKNSTRFVPEEKIEYVIPKENLVTDKSRIVALKELSANNREEALWRLQKVKPVVKVLDAPNPPFEESGASKLIYGLIGGLVGLILGLLFINANLIGKFISGEINKSIYGTGEEVKVPESLSTASSKGMEHSVTTTSSL